MQVTEQHRLAAEGYTAISAERKKQILDHIADTPSHRRQSLMNHLLSTPGETRKFLLYVFGEPHDPGASPENKAVTPPTTV